MKENFLTNAARVLCGAALLLPMVGCHRGNHVHGPGDGHTHDEGHEHEEKTAQITVWTDRYEVFAEHTAPILNEPTKFITHVTDLESLEPRREGGVTFVLRQGDVVFDQSEPEPARPGIYIPAITFPRAGDWELSLVIPGDGTTATIELGKIRVYPDAHSAAHAEFPEPPEGISFLKEQQWKIRTKAEPVGMRRLVERLQVPATIRAKPGAMAAVPAPLAGQLAAGRGGVWPRPGNHVKAGEVLGLLKPRFSDAAARFLEIEAEYGRATAALKQAEAAFARTQRLAAQQAKSARELEEAELALAAAKAQLSAAESLRSTYAKLSAADSETSAAGAALELRSPIDGVVTAVSAGNGEPVAADQTVFTILNPAKVWIEGRIAESSVARIGDAKSALGELLGDGERFISIGDEGGELVFAGLSVDPVTRTVPLIYEVPNSAGRFLIGQALRLHVETARVENGIALPDSAVVEEGGQPIAFVQVSGETFQKRELKLGIRDGDYVQVLEGLAEGERVVTEGGYVIRLASLSGAIPEHGHAH